MKPAILLIIPNLGPGGAQRVFWQQMQYLSPYFSVTGCVFNWDGAFAEEKTSSIVSLDVPAGRTYFHKLWYFILRIIRLRRLKANRSIQISISHLEGADYVNLLSKTSDKVICWIHGSKQFDANIEGLLGFVRQHLLMPLLYRQAEKIITVSAGIKREFKVRFSMEEDLLQTVYNGFDVGFIQKQSLLEVPNEFLEICRSSNVVITHGRLSRQKNLQALIHIFAEYQKQPSAKLIILGDGELRSQLIQECNHLGLKTWTCWDGSPLGELYDVYFLGYQQNPFRYLRHASLYVMTSDWEGFPLALCEAMVCGLPVITADCYTGPREIVAPEVVLPQPVKEPVYASYGVLMPLVHQSDKAIIKKWTDSFRTIFQDSGLTANYAKAGVERVRDFDIKVTIRETITIINQVKR